jgi:hypothetical protein
MIKNNLITISTYIFLLCLSNAEHKSFYKFHTQITQTGTILNKGNEDVKYIPIPEGETFEIINFTSLDAYHLANANGDGGSNRVAPAGSSYSRIEIGLNGVYTSLMTTREESKSYYHTQGGAFTWPNERKVFLSGPLTIKILSFQAYAYLLSYKVHSNNTNAINTTAIPENTKSSVNVIMEQSTDLINWSTVLPGTFNPSDKKRFFRIRAEEIN